LLLLTVRHVAASKAKANYDMMSSLKLPYMGDVDFVHGPRAAGVSGVKDAKACATYTAATLWPYRFITALLEKSVASGKLNLQTTTPATAIEETSSGFVVSTPRGAIKAHKIVHASNAYISGLLPEYSASIVPCKGICTHIAVPEGKAAPHLTNSYIVRESDKVLSYLIPRHDGGIVVGGSGQVFRPHLEQWYNNTDDSTLISASETFYDGFMQRNFHLGEVPGKKGQFVLAGFNGHGTKFRARSLVSESMLTRWQ
jgi:glycine/D-amino acid oxidase-like deaminating enzyme